MDTPKRLPRPIARQAISAAVMVVIVTMGLVVPVRDQERREGLVDRIAADATRVADAIAAYRADTGSWPAPAFDLSSGYRGGLVERDFAERDDRERWSGPYLADDLGRPTTNGFWSLAGTAPVAASPGSRWMRLHRGFGEIDDDVAAEVDALVDDGSGASGRVRVTPSWIWFEAGSVSG